MVSFVNVTTLIVHVTTASCAVAMERAIVGCVNVSRVIRARPVSVR